MRYHGGSGRVKQKGVLDFSINTNPLGVPIELENAIAECSVKEVYSRYPDYDYIELKRAIAYFYENIDYNNIIPCNGAAEALNLAILSLKPKTLIIVSPSYGDLDYELLCMSLGFKCIHYEMMSIGERFILDVEGLIDEARSKPKPVIVLSNPNNPTGTVIPVKDVEDIARELRGKAFIVVDEAYAELSSSYTGLLGRYLDENMAVVRTFTKVFGIPGLRIGFLYTESKKALERIDGIRQPWNVNAIIECALKKALTSHRESLWKYIKGSQAFIALQRVELTEKLRRLGYRVYESNTNFLLLEHEWIDSIELYNTLLRRNRIIVRPAHTFHGLTRHHTRVAVRRKWENELLVKALAETSPSKR